MPTPIDKSFVAIWNECVQAPAWDKSPVWTHGDLLPTNLLVSDDKLSAVIDFDLMGVGDPACDMIAAWSVFCTDSRDIFRKTFNVDEATWLRGMGWALSIALIIISYYQNTNKSLVTIAYRMLDEILKDWNG